MDPLNMIRLRKMGSITVSIEIALSKVSKIIQFLSCLPNFYSIYQYMYMNNDLQYQHSDTLFLLVVCLQY